ncbi:MAG: acylphosphatase, partial [Candidatus Heimdallarchaeota archaeon]
MSQHNTWELRIEGSIQGVGFRPFVYRLAQEEQVKGEVQNKGNFVRIIIQGPKRKLKSFSLNLQLKKPPLAVIEKIIKTVIHSSPTYNTFSIIKSKLESKILSPSYIPPDISICNQCLEDMLTGDRAERKHYSFTSCVDCGPRFSVIKGIPYDRPQTTMDAFPLCSKCMMEYTDPTDRRFHAQTTCCRICGPQYYLSDRTGITLETIESRVITNSQKLLLEGNILAIKGIGGTHLACRADDLDTIEELRLRKGDRKRKPFALMSLSIDQINEFAQIPSENIVNLLNSPRRPIVLLSKRDDYT